MASHSYKGHTIYECERAASEHKGRWLVQTYHETGIPYAAELCPHFGTLRAAKERVREIVQEDALFAAHYGPRGSRSHA